MTTDDRRLKDARRDAIPADPPSPLDKAWNELLVDACASDGPIRDNDVRDAIRRNRPIIERAALASSPAPAGLTDLLNAAETVVRHYLGATPDEPLMTFVDIEALDRALDAFILSSPAPGLDDPELRAHFPSDGCRICERARGALDATRPVEDAGERP